MEREPPCPLYIGLKIYFVTRNKIVIDILHAYGLYIYIYIYISYKSIFKVTQGLSETTLNIFEHEEVVIPGNLCTRFFNIRAKDTKIKIQDVQF